MRKRATPGNAGDPPATRNGGTAIPPRSYHLLDHRRSHVREPGGPGPSLILAGRETGGPGDWTHAQNPLADLDLCNCRQLETSTPTHQVATRTTIKTPPDRRSRAPGCENTHGARDRECVTPMSNDCVSRGSGNRHQSPGSDPRLE